ncbi:hypothetical protein HNQ56_000202 [Anaerotaenia torta]|uniref:hypothetical protein n=1 Tax=Anaerotaenia torta TaxID=433293 RepID=UPI003D1A5E9B
MIRKKFLCCILIICCILAGCSQKEPAAENRPREGETAGSKKEDAPSQSQRPSNTKKAGGSLKGRYVEKELSLPEDTKGSSLQLARNDQQILLYSFHETPFSITCYQLENDGTWTEITPAWIKSIPSLPKGWTYRPQVMEDGSGSQYLFYFELGDPGLKAHLLRSKDGMTYETLYPEGWNDPEYGTLTYPSMVSVMESGTIAAIFSNGEVCLYSSTDQKLLSTVNDYHYSSDFLHCSGTKLILGQCDENYQIRSIIVYDTADRSSAGYPFEVSLDDGYLYSDHIGQDLLLCNKKGIFKLEEGTSLWNSVLDGSMTSLAVPTLETVGFTADSQENYYALFYDSGSSSLMQYSFDSNVDTLPSDELNIYSLTDNNTLRQAAAVFQQNHPDIKVNFTTAMTTEEFWKADLETKEDYIRALNTELLAGTIYDILVLDGLPADSLMEKGVLADIRDLLQPMIDDGTLYKGIMDHYLREGSIYMVPARYKVNMLFGTGADTEKLNSLEALADYAASHKDAPMFGTLTPEALVDILFPYETASLQSSDGRLDREQLLRTLQQLKLVGDRCTIVENYDDFSFRGNSEMNLRLGEYLYLGSITGFRRAVAPFGMVKKVSGYYTSYANSFTPGCELGISSQSRQPELCREFLRTVLSEEVLENEFYDGFPINSKALLTSSRQDRSNYSEVASIVGQDGEEEMISFSAIDEQQVNALLKICSSVSNRVISDEHVLGAIKEKAGELLAGTLTAEAAADAIIAKLNIYLSE